MSATLKDPGRLETDPCGAGRHRCVEHCCTFYAYSTEYTSACPCCDLVVAATENIFKSGKSAYNGSECEENEYLKIMDELGGLDALEETQAHDNTRIIDKVFSLLQKHFNAESDTGDVDRSGVVHGGQNDGGNTDSR